MVRGLLAAQFPQWAGLVVRPIAGTGTVNSIFRVGDELVARFPMQGEDSAETLALIEAEAEALREFAEASSVAAPLPVAVGRPGRGFPLHWSVQTWLPGEVAEPRGHGHSHDLAADLATLIAALRSRPTHGRAFAGTGRGGDLRDHHPWVERCLVESEGLLDTTALRALWARLADLPRSASNVMSHRDLTPYNLLVADDRLTGVVDGGDYGPADPALDLVVAWHLFEEPARSTLADRLGLDELEWARSAAWAFEQSIGLVWYYRDSSPRMADLGRSTLDRLLRARPDL